MAQFIPVFAGYHQWHSSSLCLQDITNEWYSSSLCLLDMTTGTVHPCVCRISPMAQFIPVFAGYHQWHSSSLCL